jgi:endonuclease/exonuclease/phosphatase family metal-dependent hydrolase
VEVVEAGPVRTRLTRVASDHYPLLAQFRLRAPAEDVAEGGATI